MYLYNLVQAGFEGVHLENCGKFAFLLWTKAAFVWIHIMYHVSLYMNDVRHRSDSSLNQRLNMMKHDKLSTYF